MMSIFIEKMEKLS